MALDMTPEEKAVGQANFDRVAEGLTRRQFMKSLAVTGSVVVPVSAAVYFGFKSDGPGGKGPIKAALIGTGDEGGVLIGEHDPKFVEMIPQRSAQFVFCGYNDVLANVKVNLGLLHHVLRDGHH